MRWQDERYVRFYTRNTPEWCVLAWQARGLMGLILREVDRAGILELGKLGLRAVAVAVRAPWEEIEGPLAKLLEDGMVVYREDLRLLVIPNFIEAQEAPQSDKARKRAERERARDLAKAKSLTVTPLSQNVTSSSVVVTNGHEPSHDVTSGHSVLSRAVPSRAVPAPDTPPPAVHSDPEVVAMHDRIRRWPIFADLPALRIAETQTGFKPLAWVLNAIDECAAKCPDGLTLEAKQGKLVSFMRNAKRPKEAPPTVEPAQVEDFSLAKYRGLTSERNPR